MSKNLKEEISILIVDREIVFIKALSKKLQNWGYSVLTATDDSELNQVLRQEIKPSVILLDVDFSSNLIDLVKNISYTNEFPIICMASHVEPELTERLTEISRYGFHFKSANDFCLQKTIEMGLALFTADQELNQKRVFDSLANQFNDTSPSSLNNISHEKDSNKKIKDTTNFLNSIIENIPNMIFMKNAKDLRFILFNRAGEELLGYNRKDLFGKNDYDIFPKEQADFFTQKDRDVLNGGQVLDIPEEFINTPSGTRILHTKKIPVMNKEGLPEYLLGISEDITDKKESEKIIRENIERYHRLTQTVPGALYDYVLHSDGTSQMLFMSAKCNEIFEVEAEDVMKDMTILWNLIHPEDIERFRRESKEAVYSKDHFSIEARFIMPSKKEKWVQVTSRPNPKTNPNDNAVWSGFAIDITFRKVAEERIKTLLKEKEILLREVHHRIKNNMLTITSLLYLQTESLQDQAAIAALNDAVSRIQSMVLLYDKIYMSSNYNELSLFDYLVPLIDEIVNNFPTYHIVKVEKMIEDIILPTSTLFSIGIILNELITNAMKYAYLGKESGILKVSAYQKNDQIIFKVEDDGVGISNEQESKKGFGLQLVQMLSKQIHGHFIIEQSKGSQFILSIPKR